MSLLPNIFVNKTLKQRVTEQMCELNIETNSHYVVKKLLVPHE